MRPIEVCSPLFLALLIQAKRRKGKLLWKCQEIKLGNYPNSLLIYVCVRKNPNSFCTSVFGWFELGLRVVLILFCFGLEWFSGKKPKMQVSVKS